MANPDANRRGDLTTYDYDLGTFQWPIVTQSQHAQEWFNHGIRWTFAFNHDEAIRCFEYALQADPECGMARYGIAFAVGPNYNQPWSFFAGDQGKAITDRAQGELNRAQSTSAVERALIDALKARYDGEIEVRNQAYADAMAKVYDEFPNDVNVAVQYADAVMNVRSWKLWDITSGAATPEALKAKTLLERILAGHPDHPGAVHLYVHTMEMSPTPELAFKPSERLHLLIPDSGHLRHMASHITLQMGLWDDAIHSNTEAVRVDQKYISRAGADGFYSIYLAHNWHFRVYAAMQSGKKKAALESVQGLEDSIPPSLLKRLPKILESVFAMKSHVLVRFGLWEECINMPLEEDNETFAYTNAMRHYAKGTALAALGRLDEAEKQMAFLAVPNDHFNFKNSCHDLIQIARAMLHGEIEFRRRGNLDSLRQAVYLNDHLNYTEPWGWMHPPRHALGALLLESGHVEEALEVYEMDLGLRTLPRCLWNVKNVWALHGYVECLKKLGKDSRQAEEDLKAARRSADVAVESSCACRRRTVRAMV